MKMKKLSKYVLMAFSLLVSLSLGAQTTKWRDIYKVKKKDTIFGIAKKYDLTVPDLLEANPEMKKEGYELKKDDFVFIPFKKNSASGTPGKNNIPVTPAKNSTPQSNVSTRQTETNRSIRVGIMLPLHNVDGDGRRMTEYYRGVLMACDSLRRQGISTSIHAWNVNIDADITQFTKDPVAAQCDIIFGPLYTRQVRGLAEFCKARNIKMVIPFSISDDDVKHYRQIFQVYQSREELNDRVIAAYLQRFKGCHTVVIDCNDTTSNKGIFTFGLRKRLEGAGQTYSVTNLTNTEPVFAKAFSTTKPNVVILNTGRAPELTVAIAKIQSYRMNHPQARVSLFGYTEWLMYTHQHLDEYYDLDTYIPSTFYYNSLDVRTQRLEGSYRYWFHEDMQHALPRFAITGYDQAQFFIRGLRQYGNNFIGSRAQSSYRPLQTPLNFKVVDGEGKQNTFLQLVHFKKNETIESISY